MRGMICDLCGNFIRPSEECYYVTKGSGYGPSMRGNPILQINVNICDTCAEKLKIKEKFENIQKELKLATCPEDV